jgi:hypothetical protein
LGSKVDINPPKVKISAPASGQYLAGTVHFTGTASDDLKLKSVSLRYPTASGDKVQDVTVTNGSWSADLPSGFDPSTQAPLGLSEGKVTVLASATDGSGKVTTDSVLLYIDNKAPTVLVTSPTSYSAASPPIYSDYVDVKGEVWDASPVAQVNVTLHYTGLTDHQVHTVSKLADGTNTWSVRFLLKTGGTGGLTLGASDTGTVLSYSVAVTDQAGNVNTYYYHTQDIYTILTGKPAGTLFPTTLELGQVDQGLAPVSSTALISKAELTAVRLDNTVKPWANLGFSNTSAPTVQYSNLDPATPTANVLAPGSVIVGNLIPPPNTGSITVEKPMTFKIFTTAAYAVSAPPIVSINPVDNTPAGQLTLTNLGSSQSFKMALKDGLGTNLPPGQYVFEVNAKADGSGYVTDHVTFGVDSSAPTLNETAIGNSLAFESAPFAMSGSASSGSGLASLLVEESADNGATWATAYNKTYSAGVTSDASWTSSSLPIAPADGSYSYRLTLTSVSGLKSIVYRSVIYDGTPPTLSVTSPSPNSWTASSSLALSGTSGDGSGTGVAAVYYLVDDASAE